MVTRWMYEGVALGSRETRGSSKERLQKLQESPAQNCGEADVGDYDEVYKPWSKWKGSRTQLNPLLWLLEKIILVGNTPAQNCGEADVGDYDEVYKPYRRIISTHTYRSKDLPGVNGKEAERN